MARLRRLAVANHPHLVSQRGRHGRVVFVDDVDRQRYLDSLVASAKTYSVAIHAYALLDAEVHLLLTPRDANGLGRVIQAIGRRYVPAFYQRHATNDPLWAGRFDACVLDPEHSLLRGFQFVEQAPVRVGLATRARDWAWSSALHHVGVRPLPWITEPPTYWRLGNTPFEREARHEQLLEETLAPRQVEEMAGAARRGWPLGPATFVAAIADSTSRPTTAKPRGRPRLSPPV